MTISSKTFHNTLLVTKAFPYWTAVLLVAAFSFVQVAWIDASLDNICAVFFVFIAILSFASYLKYLRISGFPNSFLILLGFTLGLCVLPISLRSLEGSSLVDGLHEPLSTFGSICLFVLVTIVVHFIYTKAPFLLVFRKTLFKSLRPYLDRPATLLTCILIASIGLMALLIRSAFGDVASKLLTALVPFTNFPLALFLASSIKSQASPRSKPPSPFLFIIVALFYISSVIIGMLYNSRMAFVEPLILVFCVFSFKRLALLIPFRKSFLIVLVLALVIGIPFLNNVSASIALVRSYRSTASPAELLSMTIDSITKVKPEDLIYDKKLWWDEQYYNNEFMNRFSPIKMIDNTLYIQQGLDQSQESEYKKAQLIRLISILPNPLPSFFGVTADQKEEINKYSTADIQFGFISESTQGRRLTGSFISDVYTLFGPLASIFLYAGLLFFVFPVSDVFVTQLLDQKEVFIPSALGILMGSDNLLFFSNSSLVDMSVGYLRLIVEFSLAFFLLYGFVSIVLKSLHSGPSLR